MTRTPQAARDRAAMIGLEVEVEDEGWRERLPEIEAMLVETARVVPADGAAVVLLTDDAAVRDLNARFRGKDAATNVLSFPAPASAGHLGDLALALGVCEAEARAQGKPLADHARHLLVHGLLHLVGYDHVEEAQGDAMESLERELLAGLGVPDPYAAREDRSESAR
jgi:probable rRNA maturation factor